MKAAQHLDMSQSAATQALAELERVLDLRLFERHARGMRATPAGQALTDAARGVMSELEDVAETLAAIRLGASAALRQTQLPHPGQRVGRRGDEHRLIGQQRREAMAVRQQRGAAAGGGNLSPTPTRGG